jgi:hypothetical protein
MPLATVSSPFDYLINQIQRDLTRGVELCGEVRRNRHVGTQHRQLDELEDALRDGPYFITREYRNIIDVEGTDIDGADGKYIEFKHAITDINNQELHDQI